MAPYGGEAANYYNQQPPPPPNAYQKHAPPQPVYNNGPANGGHYAPPPYPPPQSEPKGPPPSYEEVFAIQKPKWNDVWAGLLFLATCAGFVVVSAISIQGYGEHILPHPPSSRSPFGLANTPSQPPPAARTPAASTTNSTPSA
jgi:hypothetical protein